MSEHAEIRRLWEETPASAKQIGEQFGMTKNAVIALAQKYGWQSHTPGIGGKCHPRTMAERLDALHAELNRVLQECRDRPSHHQRERNAS
jgi:hypothetical protein